MFLFPDTHFFLHYRHPQELPWTDVTDADPVHLVVCKTVQKEIEKHKFELRGRAQTRARDYASKLGRVVATNEKVTLRPAAPCVLLDYRTERPSGWTPPGDLNLNWGDDAIVADVLGFAAMHPERRIAILTGDPGLLARANSFGVPVVFLADRGWELEDEKSPVEKEAEKLRRENDDLKRSGPQIACRLNGEIDDTVRLAVTRYRLLSTEAVEALVAAMTVKHPRVVDFSLPIESRAEDWIVPTSEEVATYARQYDAWLGDLVSFVRETPTRLDTSAIRTSISLVLENDGNEPAEGTVITIESFGGVLLSKLPDDDDDGQEEADDGRHHDGGALATMNRFRHPPVAPRPRRATKPAVVPRATLEADRFASVAEQLTRTSGFDEVFRQLGHIDPILKQLHAMPKLPGDDIRRLLDGPLAARMTSPAISFPVLPRIERKRDRHAFYWRNTPKRFRVTRCEFECEEFQHRMEPEVFEMRLDVDCNALAGKNGAVRVKMFARNMRRPFEKVFPVVVTATEADVSEAVRALLP